MKFTKIKRLLVGVFSFSVACTAMAQDLIAKQAPVDVQLRAVDSIAMLKMFEIERGFDVITDIYKSWDTSNTHCYSRADIPDSLKIDLRGFSMPTTSRRVTSNFGYRPRFRRMHKGIDVKVLTGDTIYAAFDGVVRIVRFERKGYGHYVVLRHENGLETYYAHLSKTFCNVDEVVKSGQPIGLGGNTGRSFGSHLHFETRVMGEAINPAFLFDFANQDVTGDFYVFHKAKTDVNYTGPDTKSKKKAVASSKRYYKVRKGDSLSRIASRTGSSVAQLCKINRITKKTTLRPGQLLRY
ncbi:MAG: peptidoglycan DD-metalloendopeptidase family protein [Bacteroidaceae bacterium]|nr:peptidoglycan DD-metalloendopeptidase family protein [Bacteroidaceae bacterium]